jgi:hypothetical protein
MFQTFSAEKTLEVEIGEKIVKPKFSTEKMKIFKVEESTRTSFKILKCDSNNIILQKKTLRDVNLFFKSRVKKLKSVILQIN